MNHSDIAALMKGAAPAIRDLVMTAIRPLVAEIAELRQQLEVARDQGEAIRAAVADSVAALPTPRDGRDADLDAVRAMIEEAIGTIPPAAPSKDADPESVRAIVLEEVGKLPPASPGKDADPDLMSLMITDEVQRQVDALPKPQDGRSVSVEDLQPLIEERLSALTAEHLRGLPIPKDGEPGKDGAPGKLPIVREWTDDVTYEGDVRTHEGSTYQALRDTAKQPPHSDWICLARAGADGNPARQIVVRGTYTPDGEYAALDVVALNGASFIAKQDEPGVCPGDGWQLMSMQGKRGNPGEGLPGKKGDKGDTGPRVEAMSVDEQGMLTLINADGSKVECDLYPLLSRLG